MNRTAQWHRLGRLMSSATLAGPTVSHSAAAATVGRLRRAISRTNPLLAGLSSLPEAAEHVASAPVLIVDRRAAVQIISQITDQFITAGLDLTGQAPSSRSFLASPLTTLSEIGVLRTVAPHVKGIWDPFGQRRIFIAPSVLEAAQRGTLDHKDFSSWVAIRAGLWGILFSAAPWLRDELSITAAKFPSSTAQLARLVMMMDGIVRAQMEQISPRQISSARWIRNNAPESAGMTGLMELRRLGASVRSIEAERQGAFSFARHVVLDGQVATLLSDRTHMPTREELVSYESWRDRVV